MTVWDVADVWVQLMDRLGYDKFAVHDGDYGVMVAGQLGQENDWSDEDLWHA
jgi:hypothetical protein